MLPRVRYWHNSGHWLAVALNGSVENDSDCPKLFSKRAIWHLRWNLPGDGTFIILIAEGDNMNKLSLITLAAGALFATSGGASSQTIYLGPGYGPQVEPRYERDYDERRNYRHDREYDRDYNRRNYRTGNGCAPHYTVQDGVCKPYRGY
jgi:hypothetical protein